MFPLKLCDKYSPAPPKRTPPQAAGVREEDITTRTAAPGVGAVSRPALVHQLLERSAALTPGKTALVCTERRLTYRQLDELSTRLALYLVDRGVRRGDRVAVYMDNSVEAVVSIFGILKAGGVMVVLSPLLKQAKLSYIIGDAGARALITDGRRFKTALGACSLSPESVRFLLCAGLEYQVASCGSGCPIVDWMDIFEEGPIAQGSAELMLPRLIDLDLAAIIYTSGSTGSPKGVVSTHHNMLSAVCSITQYIGNAESDVVLNLLPLSFDYGLYQLLMAVGFGGTLVLEAGMAYPVHVLKRISEEQVTGLPLVPTIAALLLRIEESRARGLESVRYITNTGAHLPRAHINRLRRMFPEARLFSMYGLTECKRVCYLPPELIDTKPESVGVPMPNTEVAVVDEEGNEVGPGEVGELTVRGANVMQGYWNDPELTARVFRRREGSPQPTLYTGDLFWRDEEGHLYFVGRKDDMLKTKGERVSPRELEAELCELEGVSEAAVIGLPDPVLGQALKVFIVTTNGSLLKGGDVRKFIAARLEPFMVPKYVQFMKRLPRTSTGKVDKKALAQQGADAKSIDAVGADEAPEAGRSLRYRT